VSIEPVSTQAPPPQGDYVPAVLHGGIVHTAGMTPRRDGVLLVRGIVGQTLSIEEAREAAAVAAGNALAAVRSVLPAGAGLRCLQMTVFVACTPDFTALSAVADGASAVIAEAHGTQALPARSAIGVAALPSGAPVEVQLVAAVV
jgi:enamine deaminase RidA (YjgF/YER057c/UK114 family)